MATPIPSTDPNPLTGDLVIDAATTGFRWTLGADRTIDWSLSGGFVGEAWTAPADVQEYVQAALDIFSYYADVTFNYVGTFSTPAAAAAGGSEINVFPSGEARFFSSDLVWGRAFFPTSLSDVGSYAGAHGDVLLNMNSEANSLDSYEPGSAGWFLLIHEIGHALGLKHPHDDGGTGHPTLADLGIGELALDWATMMAYGDDYNLDQLAYDPATPMVLDVLALMYLYGPNLSTNAGHSLYNLAANDLYLTLWDAGGVDEVSAAGSDRGWEIYLPDDKLSALVPVNIGYAVPLGETSLPSPLNLYWLMGDIEDASGSQYADDIYGSVLDNYIWGLGGDDWILGWDGDDSLDGGAGADQITGDDGDDTIEGGAGLDYLRGNEGDDVITGGADFDDAHGNMGNDTVSGGLGEDWVVGGKDNDLLNGDDEFDVVYGNLGNDTVNGGVGNDWVRGGQNEDVLDGGAGDDWLAGDKGSDTVTGGAGADIFHTHGEAGLDRVLDFSGAEGDRVLLLAGTTYTVSQSGSDTVIDMTGGGQMVLVGVQLASLPDGWIFGA